ncbi:hypothetical protein [Alteromonas confluentis]|uniref:Uncharacterized protein n=1 Tax=Alteromonas confluentis TaxID=1656094 RepID=A0A1E7ZA49_9ALTE|nr:hypothetical protein [Alteromonas confluentis]OFC70413.1 hypothetical protein BFC18_14715 [Alteromonas confluentis]
MLRILIAVFWLISFIAIFATPFPGYFAVITAMITVAVFFFPISYGSREEVQLSSQTPLKMIASPIPYLFLAALGVGVFFVWFR